MKIKFDIVLRSIQLEKSRVLLYFLGFNSRVCFRHGKLTFKDVQAESKAYMVEQSHIEDDISCLVLEREPFSLSSSKIRRANQASDRASHCAYG